MKKSGLLIGVGFLAGALFFALSFGFLQKSEKNEPIISPAVALAESVAGPAAGAGSVDFAPIVRKVKPAVVQGHLRLSSWKAAPFLTTISSASFSTPRGARQRRSGEGSGFFISADGYILTNNHVVQDAVKVKSGHRRKEGVHRQDHRHRSQNRSGADQNQRQERALHRAWATPARWRWASGCWPSAIPSASVSTVTAGIISAKGRQLQMADIRRFPADRRGHQQGNSGGPLINMKGEAIGINSTIVAPAGGNIGIGFAVPSNLAKKVVSDLKTKGKVVRGWFGITMIYVDESVVKEYDQPTTGALITAVVPDSPAQKAGLKKNDLVVEVNGKRITSSNELQLAIANANPGDTVEVTIYRNNVKQKISVKVGEAQQSPKARGSSADAGGVDLGMSLEKNSPTVARENELKTSAGVVVTNVVRDGAAYQNGLRPGDVIVAINRTEITSVEQFRRIMNGREPGSSVLMYINRSGEETAIRFTIPEE